MRAVLILLLAAGLSGCGLPAAVLIPAGVSAIGVGITAVHYCHQDHGCTYLPVPP